MVPLPATNEDIEKSPALRNEGRGACLGHSIPLKSATCTESSQVKRIYVAASAPSKPAGSGKIEKVSRGGALRWRNSLFTGINRRESFQQARQQRNDTLYDLSRALEPDDSGRLRLDHFPSHEKKQAAVAFIRAAEQVAEFCQGARVLAGVAPGDRGSVPSLR